MTHPTSPFLRDTLTNTWNTYMHTCTHKYMHTSIYIFVYVNVCTYIKPSGGEQKANPLQRYEKEISQMTIYG